MFLLEYDINGNAYPLSDFVVISPWVYPEFIEWG